MSLSLKPVSLLDGKPEWELLQRLPSESGFENDGHGIELDDFPDWLERNVNSANGINLPNGYVPQHLYWLMLMTENGESQPIGLGKLRLPLTKLLLQHGGNIGYGIEPDARGKGYGSVFLALLLERAKAKGMDMVMLTVNSNNLASSKTIESHGGILEKEVDGSCWYWIYI